jgi:cytochrome d ubiquinol oxidase subunit II
MSYLFLQQYWWAIISLLAALLVFLLFVQGGNTLLYELGRSEDERRLMLHATGRKWELTFTTLVTFGGAFFAAFPLFYSTSFGGAYWLWMLLLFSFVLQAVSYEFQGKLGNLLGARTYRAFLEVNGVVGPLLLGGAVATFFTGSNFLINQGNLLGDTLRTGGEQTLVISRWANASHGLDALLDVRNLLLGLALLCLARCLGELYFIQRIESPALAGRCRRMLRWDAAAFLVLFLSFLGWLWVGDGYAVATDGRIYMEPHKYLHNLWEMPVVGVLFVVGVALVLYGLGRTIFSPAAGGVGSESAAPAYRQGIFPVGLGTVLTVFSLLLTAGWNDTAFYPSAIDPQSSLTLANSCSSEFTLRTMFYVSLFVPFVLAYIIYVWRALEDRPIDEDELRDPA